MHHHMSRPSPLSFAKSSCEAMAEDRGFSDLFSSASSLLNSQSHSSSSTPSHGHTSSKPPAADEGYGKPHSSTSSSQTHKPPSYGQIYESAQVVMNAVKNKVHSNEASSAAENADYGKLAGAAGTLLSAVSHYGKLEETGVGKYAQKAQEYLHAYEVKHSKPGMAVPPSQSSASHASSSGYGPSSTPSEVNYSQPSAPSQGYPSGYPPQGYPDVNQSYGTHASSRPAESHGSVDTYPPVGYPPAGYPTSGGSHYK